MNFHFLFNCFTRTKTTVVFETYYLVLPCIKITFLKFFIKMNFQNAVLYLKKNERFDLLLPLDFKEKISSHKFQNGFHTFEKKSFESLLNLYSKNFIFGEKNFDFLEMSCIPKNFENFSFFQIFFSLFYFLNFLQNRKFVTTTFLKNKDFQKFSLNIFKNYSFFESFLKLSVLVLTTKLEKQSLFFHQDNLQKIRRKESFQKLSKSLFYQPRVSDPLTPFFQQFLLEIQFSSNFTLQHLEFFKQKYKDMVAPFSLIFRKHFLKSTFFFFYYFGFPKLILEQKKFGSNLILKLANNFQKRKRMDKFMTFWCFQFLTLSLFVSNKYLKVFSGKNFKKQKNLLCRKVWKHFFLVIFNPASQFHSFTFKNFFVCFFVFFKKIFSQKNQVVSFLKIVKTKKTKQTPKYFKELVRTKNTKKILQSRYFLHKLVKKDKYEKIFSKLKKFDVFLLKFQTKNKFKFLVTRNFFEYFLKIYKIEDFHFQNRNEMNSFYLFHFVNQLGVKGNNFKKNVSCFQIFLKIALESFEKSFFHLFTISKLFLFQLNLLQQLDFFFLNENALFVKMFLFRKKSCEFFLSNFLFFFFSSYFSDFICLNSSLLFFSQKKEFFPLFGVFFENWKTFESTSFLNISIQKKIKKFKSFHHTVKFHFFPFPKKISQLSLTKVHKTFWLLSKNFFSSPTKGKVQTFSKISLVVAFSCIPKKFLSFNTLKTRQFTKNFPSFTFQKLQFSLLFDLQKKKTKMFFFQFQPTIHEIHAHLDACFQILKNATSSQQLKFMTVLSKKILDWSQIYEKSLTKEICSYCDSFLLKCLWNWAKKTHPTKTKHWIRQKYFHFLENKKWFFGKKRGPYLFCLPRHSLIRN